MSKFTNLANLDKLAKALNNRCKNLIDEEKARAIAEEQLLQTEINITKDMFGGKSIKYITQAEYDNLSEAEKNSDTVTYFITDGEDLSHEHENKEFLDNLAARNISIGNKSQVFDGVNDLHYSISDIGAAPAVHNHDDRYFTETEINTKISEINDNIDGHVADLNAAIAGKANIGHNHDDRYFTETEVTNKLAGKADTGHTHDDMYYTETEIDGKISTLNNAINGKAPSTHTHDDRYYTETEINGKIEDINETINTNVSTLNTAIATAKSGAISESKSYTDTAISKLVDSAPEAMNTLNELAKAIGDHQTEYEAYVATVSANIATAKAEAIAEAAKKDTALHTTISAEIDADVKVEKERAMEAENALQNAINGKANASHGNHVPATQTADNTKFLRNDNTWATVTPANIGAAAASHGNHVPATQTASNKVFLRNDNTWATVTPANIGAAPATHTHDDRYYTETEINGKIEDINEIINNKEAALQSSIANLTNNKADISYVNGKLEVVDAIKLNGYSIWVGTTAELEAIETRDPNTLYFEIGDETGEEVVQVDIVNGVLQLTADKYQKTNMLDGTEILFPSVNKFTEIHLYFAAGSNMNINLPDNCKWRVEPNIEEGNSYEIVATYNTIEWLVNVIVYS